MRYINLRLTYLLTYTKHRAVSESSASVFTFTWLMLVLYATGRIALQGCITPVPFACVLMRISRPMR